jgi:hypothetical protein
MLHRCRASLALAVLACSASGLAGCASPPPAAPPASGSSIDGGASAIAAAPPEPVPEALVTAAKKFGLTMLAEGFTWKAIDPKATRFEWSGRSASGDREILYSFWLPKLEATETKFLSQLVSSAAANLAQGEPCRAFEQPTDFVKILGVDRVISVCFEASPFYGKEFHHGIMHGIVNGGALTLVVVLSNDRAAAVVPLPKSIGARGK